MYAIWRAVVLGVVVTLGVVLGAGWVQVSAQASNPRFGTWTLNVAKSKSDPGPAGIHTQARDSGAEAVVDSRRPGPSRAGCGEDRARAGL